MTGNGQQVSVAFPVPWLDLMKDITDIPFQLKEFIITRPKRVELAIADKIYKYHIIPMVTVRKLLGVPMWASKRSGYRPKWWELSKGRSGKSQHCFEGKGAVDWTFSDFEKNLPKFLNLVQKYTGYTRISVYHAHRFVHCDYKNTEDDAYVYYLKDGEWNRDYPINRVA